MQSGDAPSPRSHRNAIQRQVLSIRGGHDGAFPAKSLLKGFMCALSRRGRAVCPLDVSAAIREIWVFGRTLWSFSQKLEAVVFEDVLLC